MAIKISQHVSLANYTSFHVGGDAEYLALVSTTEELIEVLKQQEWTDVWLLGYGSNTLISDSGLPGLTVVMRGGLIARKNSSLIVDAGVWWDDVVKTAIEADLWGAELMSEIPGSLGAALFINITAYGQSIGPLVEWVEVWDKKQQNIKRYQKEELQWAYKSSIFQHENHADEVILRASLQFHDTPQDDIVYQKALDVAEELGVSTRTLSNRRKIIVEARHRAGSLWSPEDKNNRTAGSFFRNAIVSHEKALEVASYDESGKSTEQIMKMNKVHGGDETRVSAAHLMLAAGFFRGQKFGEFVKLHDQNLLKIEALEGATAKNIYDAMTFIISSVKEKLDVDLQAEAQLLGKFGL